MLHFGLRNDDHSQRESTEDEPLLSGSSDTSTLYVGRPYARKVRLRIPTMVWFIMKITCVFYERKVTTTRRCFKCHLFDQAKLAKLKIPPAEEEDNSDENSEGETQYSETSFDNRVERPRNRCEVCSSSWWDCDGRVSSYTDEDIGVETWNHRGSWFMSLITLTGLIIYNSYEFYTFCYYNKDRNYYLVNILSFFIFMTILSLYPIMSLVSKVKSLSCVSPFSWSYTLNARYIITRLQFIQFRKHGMPGKAMLTLCYLWPTELFIHRLLIYSRLHICPKREGIVASKVQTLIFVFFAMVIWTNFNYLLFLCRMSFVRQFRLVQQFVQTHQGDLDACRGVICTVVRDFNCYRKFVYLYMILMLQFCTWGITTSVCMQYKIGEKGIPCINILWMIWSEHFMFLSLSLSAVGGLDVTYMWDHFRLNILTARHSPDKERFWRKLAHHMDHMCLESNSISWTMAVSFVTSYSAVYSSGLQ